MPLARKVGIVFHVSFQFQSRYARHVNVGQNDKLLFFGNQQVVEGFCDVKKANVVGNANGLLPTCFNISFIYAVACPSFTASSITA